MDAITLNCPTCGAVASTGATECAFCRARLATVACPSCFGLVFAGSHHCAHCGAVAERTVRDAKPHRCPRGCQEMRHISVGGTELLECERCAGVWVDGPTFQRLCTEGERQAAVLAADPGAARRADGRTETGERVRYSPLPRVRQTTSGQMAPQYRNDTRDTEASGTLASFLSPLIG